ncbi:nucleic acid-binding, OB-fold protein [Tanacetum coccineum]|uniref:Nucleic acid-binding, OB-fold protein n=1 Tax=Tanacetum coccineum TaxID=301880 RepID=A0ABQ5DA81_9ASTR
MDTYNYCFKEIIGDRSATISVTCFSNQASTLTRDYNELLAELLEKDPYRLPSTLKDLEGTTHTFQFHFDSESTSKRLDFVLDRVFKPTMLSLTAPSAQNIAPASTSQEQPEKMQPPKSLSPALSTIASNEPENDEEVLPEAAPLKRTEPDEARRISSEF